MERCECHGLPKKGEITLTLECLDCEGGVVRCKQCGQPKWWSDERRDVALNAAEAHRWETGHMRVVARGFGGQYQGQIVMEVRDM